MYSFDDLQFKIFYAGDYQIYGAKIFFPNGYGASVVQGYGTYGVEKGLYELAVIIGTDESNWELCYTTDITDDVLGYLSKQNVTDLLNRIANL